LFKIDLTRQPKTGYAIQIASMTQHASMMREVRVWQTAFSDKILVNVERGKDGTPDYRVLFGTFSSPTSATQFLQSLKSKNLKGFVVELKTLR
jgi:septal ring-binding cell division protein DamX